MKTFTSLMNAQYHADVNEAAQTNKTLTNNIIAHFARSIQT